MLEIGVPNSDILELKFAKKHKVQTHNEYFGEADPPSRKVYQSVYNSIGNFSFNQ